eukprot:364491-Chlamydomonas_euryale.AAC.5
MFWKSCFTGKEVGNAKLYAKAVVRMHARTASCRQCRLLRAVGHVGQLASIPSSIHRSHQAAYSVVGQDAPPCKPHLQGVLSCWITCFLAKACRMVVRRV